MENTVYKPNLDEFPNPSVPKRPGKAPKVTDSPFKFLQGIHGKEFKGYPATSSAQILGVLCGVTLKAEGEYVLRTMIRLGLKVKGDIANTVKGNAVKHLPPRAGKYAMPKYEFPKPVANYILKTYAVVVKEARAEAVTALKEATN